MEKKRPLSKYEKRELRITKMMDRVRKRHGGKEPVRLYRVDLRPFTPKGMPLAAPVLEVREIVELRNLGGVTKVRLRDPATGTVTYDRRELRRLLDHGDGSGRRWTLTAREALRLAVAQAKELDAEAQREALKAEATLDAVFRLRDEILGGKTQAA